MAVLDRPRYKISLFHHHQHVQCNSHKVVLQITILSHIVHNLLDHNCVICILLSLCCLCFPIVQKSFQLFQNVWNAAH